MFFEQKAFVDGNGSLILGRFPVDDQGNPIEGTPSFQASGKLVITLTTGEKCDSEFNFRVPGDSLVEAFTNFPEALEVAKACAVDEFKAEMKKRFAPKLVEDDVNAPRGNIIVTN